MKPTIKTIVSLLLCLCLCNAFPLGALASDSVVVPMLDKDDVVTEPPISTEVVQEEKKTPEPSGASDNVVVPMLPKDDSLNDGIDPKTTGKTYEDGETRTYNDVVRTIGIDHAAEIINIDGLDVPLADGSTFYIPFVDIAADAYYTEAVAWAYKHDPQITAGVTELSFGPNQTCTRGQMVTFLWRAAGCPEPAGTASAFSDVTAGAYYEKAVAWAVENNITDGVGDGRFAPNGIVNRAQAVTFLYRAKGAPETAASESFADVASGAWYENAVAWAVASGVTNGVSDSSFAPASNCVRGQTVTFLYRAYK